MQMRDKVGKSRNTVFFQWFVASEGRKVGSLKRRVLSHLARWEMKNCTPLWREAYFQVKMYKTHHARTTVFVSLAAQQAAWHGLILRPESRTWWCPKTGTRKSEIWHLEMNKDQTEWSETRGGKHQKFDGFEPMTTLKMTPSLRPLHQITILAILRNVQTIIQSLPLGAKETYASHTRGGTPSTQALWPHPCLAASLPCKLKFDRKSVHVAGGFEDAHISWLQEETFRVLHGRQARQELGATYQVIISIHMSDLISFIFIIWKWTSSCDKNLPSANPIASFAWLLMLLLIQISTLAASSWKHVCLFISDFRQFNSMCYDRKLSNNRSMWLPETNGYCGRVSKKDLDLLIKGFRGTLRSHEKKTAE